MRPNTILFTLLTLAFGVSALPNNWPESHNKGLGKESKGKPEWNNKPTPAQAPHSENNGWGQPSKGNNPWSPEPHHGGNPWKPEPPKGNPGWPEPPHYTAKPTLSWTGTTTQTWAHMPTQSVHYGGWKRSEHSGAKDNNWGPPPYNPGHMQSVTHKPWNPMPTPTGYPVHEWPQPGKPGEPEGPGGWGHPGKHEQPSWPQPSKPESGNGWSEGAGRAQHGWKRDTVLEA